VSPDLSSRVQDDEQYLEGTLGVKNSIRQAANLSPGEPADNGSFTYRQTVIVGMQTIPPAENGHGSRGVVYGHGKSCHIPRPEMYRVVRALPFAPVRSFGFQWPPPGESSSIRQGVAATMTATAPASPTTGTRRHPSTLAADHRTGQSATPEKADGRGSRQRDGERPMGATLGATRMNDLVVLPTAVNSGQRQTRPSGPI
jgi:hypothetical protein